MDSYDIESHKDKRYKLKRCMRLAYVIEKVRSDTDYCSDSSKE